MASSSGPTQRGTPRRGSNQGAIDRFRNKYGIDPDPTMRQRTDASKKFTMSKKDQELEAQAADVRETERNAEDIARLSLEEYGQKQNPAKYSKGGKIKKYAKSGSIRGGGCESKGKTKGRFV